MNKLEDFTMQFLGYVICVGVFSGGLLFWAGVLYVVASLG